MAEVVPPSEPIDVDLIITTPTQLGSGGGTPRVGLARDSAHVWGTSSQQGLTEYEILPEYSAQAWVTKTEWLGDYPPWDRAGVIVFPVVDNYSSGNSGATCVGAYTGTIYISSGTSNSAPIYQCTLEGEYIQRDNATSAAIPSTNHTANNLGNTPGIVEVVAFDRDGLAYPMAIVTSLVGSVAALDSGDLSPGARIYWDNSSRLGAISGGTLGLQARKVALIGAPRNPVGGLEGNPTDARFFICMAGSTRIGLTIREIKISPDGERTERTILDTTDLAGVLPHPGVNSGCDTDLYFHAATNRLLVLTSLSSADTRLTAIDLDSLEVVWQLTEGIPRARPAATTRYPSWGRNSRLSTTDPYMILEGTVPEGRRAILVDVAHGFVFLQGDSSGFSPTDGGNITDQGNHRLWQINDSGDVRILEFPVPDVPPEGQDFISSVDFLDGFRSVRLARNNVTGVLNDYFLALQANLEGYADADGDTLSQQAIDMNLSRITNLSPATALGELITKQQAEGGAL